MAEIVSWASIAVAIITVCVAAIVASITYRQYRTARDQLRLALFDRRFSIYNAVRMFLSHIEKNGSLRNETLPEFYDALQRANFLFGEGMNKYLGEIKCRSLALSMAEVKINDATGSEMTKEAVAQKFGELRWLLDQLHNLHEKFGPYMNFHDPDIKSERGQPVSRRLQEAVRRFSNR